MTKAPAPISNSDWPAPTQRPQLDAGTVDVWRVDLDTPLIDIQKMRTELQADELRRGDSLRGGVLRHRYLTAHWAVRHILAGYAQRSAKSLVFEAGKYGKPFLSQPGSATPLLFNLAHSANLALVAVAHVEVGIDLEQLRPLPQISEAAQQVLSAQEISLANHLGDDDRQAALHILWTCKEAYVKSTGTGLRRDLPYLTVLQEPPRETFGWFPLDSPLGQVSAHLLNPRKGFFAALVVMGTPQRLRCRQFSTEAFSQLSLGS
jgi:4'-phosphopantetheinyl transferase